MDDFLSKQRKIHKRCNKSCLFGQLHFLKNNVIAIPAHNPELQDGQLIMRRIGQEDHEISMN
jgi:hypothetical protein